MKRCLNYCLVTIFLICSLWLPGICVAENPGIESPLRFVVIGDRTGGNVTGIYENIIAEIDRLKPDFVITVGDMIEGYTTDNERLHKEWNEYLDQVAPLSMPIYYTPGNHDISMDQMLPIYQEYIGNPYHSFNIRSYHFVVLDNSRWETSNEMRSEQLDWLEKDLGEHKDAELTFIFFHKPFWLGSIAKGKSDVLHDLFKEKGVDAVFTGHYHEYFSGRYDGIIYTSIGSSGGACQPGPTGLKHHFAWVTVNKDQIHIAPIKMGSVLAWTEVTAEELNFIHQLDRGLITFEQPVMIDDDLTVKASKLSLSVHNLLDQNEFNGELIWEIPTGWQVEKKILPVSLKPEQVQTYTFSVISSGKLYPLPKITLPFPYGQEKNYTVKKSIPVARSVTCKRTVKQIKIDGKLTEPVWQSPTTSFFAPDGSAVKSESVSFYFAYDRENVYLAAHCSESEMQDLRAKITERDGPIYYEDCVGYFLQPNIEQEIVYQVYVNPLGTVFDQKLTVIDQFTIENEKGWNGQYTVGIHRSDEHWSIEIKIPLKQFGVDAQQGQKWKLNFRRKQKRLETAADWLVPISYNPQTYGFLEFR